jgi:hypothetical protein
MSRSPLIVRAGLALCVWSMFAASRGTTQEPTSPSDEGSKKFPPIVIPADARPFDLIPMPMGPPRPWKLNEDLDTVPEVRLHDPISAHDPEAARYEIRKLVAKFRHLDAILYRPDLEEIPHLQGLPFVHENCRMPRSIRRHFRDEATSITQFGLLQNPFVGARPTFHVPMVRPSGPDSYVVKKDAELLARLRAAVQVLTAQDAESRLRLVQELFEIPHPAATRELAKVALFAPEEVIRKTAIRGLSLRRESDYLQDLVAGFRYPIPVIAERAADASIKLRSQAILRKLAELLAESDPRFVDRYNPWTHGRSLAVREVVKINHHRNCLLCHAPSDRRDFERLRNGGGDSSFAKGLVADIPTPGQELPKNMSYSSVADPERSIRFDVTYLRQDFSLCLPVADAKPWPDKQRFDFLVRTRVLSPEEEELLKSMIPTLPRSAMHRAALRALREATGLNDIAPTSQAWGKAVQNWRKPRNNHSM